MAKIFKGIKQVSAKAFKEASDLEGYLWFVRTEVSEPEVTVIDGEEVVVDKYSNDEYDIYFGKRHYGHFCEGEIDGLKNSIKDLEGLKGNVDGILKTLDEFVATLEEQHNVITGNTKAIEEIKANLADVLVKDVDSNDKVLSVADGILSSKIELVYEDTKIKLYGKSKTVTETDETGNEVTREVREELGTIDASAFVKDGILEDVEVVTIEEVDEENNPHGLVAGEKYIKFVWNTDGESKEDYILASEIGATYTGSDSIDISSDNKIEVKQVGGDKVNITEIPVGGTPLADLLTKNDINTINAGNLQEVLEALFSKEDWPTNPRRVIPSSASASQSAPTISFSKTIAKVGERITVSASAKTATGSATVSYSGFTYGYKTSASGDKTDGNPSSVTKNIVRTDGNYGLTAQVTTGFTSLALETSGITTSSTSANLPATYLIVDKGANKVKVTTTTPTFSITIPQSDMPKYYACSTLKKANEDHIVSAATEDKVYTGLTASSSSETSVTGVYPIFINGTWAVDPVTNNAGDGQSNANTAYGKTGTTGSFNEKLTSLTNGTSTFYAFIAFGNGGFTIKLPTGWVVEAAQKKSDLKTGYFDGNLVVPTPTVNDSELVVAAIKDGETVIVPETTHTYNIYNFDISASNVVRLKIKTGAVS